MKRWVRKRRDQKRNLNSNIEIHKLTDGSLTIPREVAFKF